MATGLMEDDGKSRTTQAPLHSVVQVREMGDCASVALFYPEAEEPRTQAPERDRSDCSGIQTASRLLDLTVLVCKPIHETQLLTPVASIICQQQR